MYILQVTLPGLFNIRVNLIMKIFVNFDDHDVCGRWIVEKNTH